MKAKSATMRQLETLRGKLHDLMQDENIDRLSDGSYQLQQIDRDIAVLCGRIESLPRRK